MRFSVPPGTAAYFGQYHEPAPSKAAYYTLDGDLNQMGIMERRLREAGFDVVRSPSGTYPGFPEDSKEEFVRALQYLYKYRVPGWWNQRFALIANGVCTAEEWQIAIDAEV